MSDLHRCLTSDRLCSSRSDFKFFLKVQLSSALGKSHSMRCIPVLVLLLSSSVALQAAVREEIPGSELAYAQRDSQPLLFGPPEDHPTLAKHDDKKDSTTPTPTPTRSATRTTQTTAKTKDEKTSTAPATSTAEHADTSTTSSAETQSATPSPTPHSKSNPLMPLAYLSPLFLLVLVSLGGWSYSRWYALKTQEEQRYTIPPAQSFSSARPSSTSILGLSKGRDQALGKWSFRQSDQWRSGGNGGGWKSLHDLDTVDEEKYEVNGEKLDPDDPWYAGEVDTVWQDVELGHAQGDSVSVVTEDRHGHEGKKVEFTEDTVKNVSRWRSTFTIWRSGKNTVPAARPYEDPFIAPALSPDLSGPTAPGWIVPRSTVTSPQLLSPPMQPHLFFHPSQPNEGKDAFEYSDSHTLHSTSSDESSILGNAAEMAAPEHERWPTIPSSATALAQATAYDLQYTSMPVRTPRTPSGQTPATIKRSTGRMDLSGDLPTPKPAMRSAMKGSRGMAQDERTPTKSGLMRTPTKSRVQQRQDQAQETVNNILQASWSDRLLASSVPPTSIDGMMVSMSRNDLNGPISSGLDGMVLGSRNPFE